ncbi:hypothetical protein I131_03605 [Enterococcus faecium CRL1879]|nr:hypothetical protein I131_03605 [Enterococcus faecium CRL1879]
MLFMPQLVCLNIATNMIAMIVDTVPLNMFSRKATVKIVRYSTKHVPKSDQNQTAE